MRRPNQGNKEDMRKHNEDKIRTLAEHYETDVEYYKTYIIICMQNDKVHLLTQYIDNLIMAYMPTG